MLEVTPGVVIAEDEISFVASPSSGPGGQNVNKVSTRVTLLFDVAHSPSLSDAQRQRLLQRLKNRINDEGVLRVVAQVHRTQKANREEAFARFTSLVQQAFVDKPVRKKTGVPASARAERLRTKRRTSDLKRSRTQIPEQE